MINVRVVCGGFEELRHRTPFYVMVVEYEGQYQTGKVTRCRVMLGALTRFDVLIVFIKETKGGRLASTCTETLF